MGEYVVGITGASGAAYGCRLTEFLTSNGHEVRLVVSDAGSLTLGHECHITPEELAQRTGAHRPEHGQCVEAQGPDSAPIQSCDGRTATSNR